MIAIARMNIPAIFVYGGTIKPGHFDGHGPHDRQRLRSGRRIQRQQNRRSTNCKAVERNACPGAGSCGGMYTANTMSSAIEAMGMSLPYSSTMAAEDEEKADSAAESARGAGRGDPQSTPAAPDHDAPGVRKRDRRGDGGRRIDQRGAASAGDRARRRSEPDDRRLRTDSPRVPVLCDLKPSGQYVTVDLHRAGGIPQVMKMLLAHGVLHGDALTHHRPHDRRESWRRFPPSRRPIRA